MAKKSFFPVDKMFSLYTQLVESEIGTFIQLPYVLCLPFPNTFDWLFTTLLREKHSVRRVNLDNKQILRF